MNIADTHCHIDFPQFDGRLSELLENAKQMEVSYMVCAAVNLEDFPRILNLVESKPGLFASVGVHPNYTQCEEPSVERLVQLSKNEKVVAIGETGLDYFRSQGDLEWQRERFKTHILAAREAHMPIIVHSRKAPEDTMRILKENGADGPRGVMHCFTGDYPMAKAALDLGFYISFSGIVTFKNSTDLASVAKKIPLDRMLVETDSPYLSPVPMRGKENQPAYVRYTAEFLAQQRGMPLEQFAEITTSNFIDLFRVDPAFKH